MAPPLPARDGVGASVVVLPPGAWPTIAAFLVQRFAHVAPEAWVERMARGEVVDARGVPVTPERRHEPGLKVFYYRAIDAEPRIPFEEAVLFQDEHLVVADKPHFLPVTPGGRYLQETLLVRLKRRLGAVAMAALVPLHRLDRETAGLVLFSADPGTRGRYQNLFRDRQMAKVYEAIVPWRGELPALRTSRIERGEHFMQMREVAGEPNAETRFTLLEARGGLARLRLEPVTGRTHQLRVHCAAIGMPIVGDTLYPTLLPAGSDDAARPLQLLAQSLAFDDPLTGAPRAFSSRFTLRLDAGG